MPVKGGPVTFTAPPNSTLSSGVTYWLRIGVEDDFTYHISIHHTIDNSEVQGPDIENRWFIQGNRVLMIIFRIMLMLSDSIKRERATDHGRIASCIGTGSFR